MQNKLIKGHHYRKQGRNTAGIIVAGHRGGGNKRLYRYINFKRNEINLLSKVITIDKDPNRNAYICLINFYNGEKKYILYPDGIKIGDEIISGIKIPIDIGNALSLKNIYLGTLIHNLEMLFGVGGKIARMAGSSAKIVSNNSNYYTLKLPSGKLKLIFNNCLSTIGKVGSNNIFKISYYKSLSKAGIKRWIGKRPLVRGSAMNAIDHPHGGGEGKTSIGLKSPKTPWGLLKKRKK
uniref:ribosomal protein L2 n=1 Tax=Pogoniopsis schenckii TaxID=1582014 RepID=UPI002238CD0A|nr:ribosomal protein L2 [Pogoniopsis schenckii]UYP51010.1 ribosomal protein L2 [Pogoniopsis schenckii]